jgi:hypothetical protein
MVIDTFGEGDRTLRSHRKESMRQIFTEASTNGLGGSQHLLVDSSQAPDMIIHISMVIVEAN